MTTNYFSDMVNHHNEKKETFYQVVCMATGHIHKETKDIAIAELTKHELLDNGYHIEIKTIKK